MEKLTVNWRWFPLAPQSRRHGHLPPSPPSRLIAASRTPSFSVAGRIVDDRRRLPQYRRQLNRREEDEKGRDEMRRGRMRTETLKAYRV